MRIIFDIEANGLENPTEIWLICAKNIDTGEVFYFRNVTKNAYERERFILWQKDVQFWCGHHILGFDLPVLHFLIGLDIDRILPISIDTLVVSKLVDYGRKGGHSLESFGEEFGHDKLTFFKFTDKELYNCNSILFKQLEAYCLRDVEVSLRLYNHLVSYINDCANKPAIELEQQFQLVVNDLHHNGFSFDVPKAKRFLEKVEKELGVLDKDILEAFPPKEILIREFTPKVTKFGTISRTSVPRSLHHEIHLYKPGEKYRHTRLETFNPASHKQLIEVLNTAGWSPTDKTQTHIDTERELNQLKRTRNRDPEIDIKIKLCQDKIKILQQSGWRINENNLTTLPSTAPAGARLLAKRILLEARRRSLTEWLKLVRDDGRIHGYYYGIGAWTHRMSHQKPNTANIPTAYHENGSPKLLGKEMRALWKAPKNRLLVGVDAEGIQLRIFAHYINDKEFTDALVNGRKEDKTDPHSLNQSILGPVCKSRQAAKRFIYALLLGAGINKLAQVLDASLSETEDALNHLLGRYQGFQYLKKSVIPSDAKQGFFIGLDGRTVKIPGDTVGERRHLCMSGYLQNGEGIIIKKTAIKAAPSLAQYKASLINIVHDEFIIEGPNDIRTCEKIKNKFETSIEEVGKELNLKCPLKGDGSIGLNWFEIH